MFFRLSLVLVLLISRGVRHFLLRANLLRLKLVPFSVPTRAIGVKDHGGEAVRATNSGLGLDSYLSEGTTVLRD